MVITKPEVHELQASLGCRAIYVYRHPYNLLFLASDSPKRILPRDEKIGD